MHAGTPNRLSRVYFCIYLFTWYVTITVKEQETMNLKRNEGGEYEVNGTLRRGMV